MITYAQLDSLTAGMKVRAAADMLRPGHHPVTVTLTTRPALAEVPRNPRQFAWMRGTVDGGETRTLMVRLSDADVLSPRRIERVSPGIM